MEIMKKTILLIVVSLLVFGCSKKQEDAAKLEQEMLAKDEAPVDTAVDTEAVDDSAMVEAVTDVDVAAVPAEEPQATMPARPVGDGYAVQVASCESADYARYLVEKYTKREYDPYISEISVEGQLFHRVRLGPYETLSEAKEVQAKLLSDYTQESWIDPVTQ